MPSGESALVPDIGMMREHVVLCDGMIEPSPDDTLEVIQPRYPLRVLKAQVQQARSGRVVDYRQDSNLRVVDHYVVFRAQPGLLMTVNDLVFWAERKPHFECDVWFKVVEVGEMLGHHRFTRLNCQLFMRVFPHDRKLPQPQPVREQEPLY